MVVWERNLEYNLPVMYASPPNFRDWRDQNQTLTSLAAFSGGDYSVAQPEGAAYVPGARVSAGLFEMLGVNPLFGRTFTPLEDNPGAEPPVILGYETWQTLFAGRNDLLGTRMTLNGQLHTVVGIMPAGFDFPPRIVTEGNETSVRPGLWVPFSVDYSQQRGARYMTVLGRLKPGVGIIQAQEDLNQVAQQLAQDYPNSNQGWDIVVTRLRDQVVGNVRPQLWILLGAVAFVLLIACVNVANLLLARGATRNREFAIRAALGASRSRVIRQLLVESQFLALLGGLAGLALAVLGIETLIRLAPSNIPRIDETVVEGRVLFFTLILCLATGMIFGLTPALRSFSTNLEQWLRAGGRSLFESGNSRLRAGLVVAEVALSLILLVGAGLLFQSLVNLRSAPSGFQSSGVLTSKLVLPQSSFPDANSWVAGYRELGEEVRNLPGVEAAGLILDIPLGDDRQGTGFMIEGEPPQRALERNVNFSILTPGYFEAMQVQLVEGRQFRDTDDANSEPVIIINRNFAERFFPNGDAIGNRIYAGIQSQVPRRIIGIVGDVRHNRLSDDPAPTMYLPFYERPWSRRMTLVTRSRLETAVVIRSIRSVIGQLDPAIAFYEIRPMDEVVEESIAQPRFAALMLVVFSGVALLMASVGIYGVISFMVSRRVQETGILVLGAQKRDILQLVVSEGMRQVLLGIVLGVGASLLLSRFLRSFLYRISAGDVTTLIVVSLLLGGVALLACCIPAWRATRLNPVQALRQF